MKTLLNNLGLILLATLFLGILSFGETPPASRVTSNDLVKINSEFARYTTEELLQTNKDCENFVPKSLSFSINAKQTEFTPEKIKIAYDLAGVLKRTGWTENQVPFKLNLSASVDKKQNATKIEINLSFPEANGIAEHFKKRVAHIKLKELPFGLVLKGMATTYKTVEKSKKRDINFQIIVEGTEDTDIKLIYSFFDQDLVSVLEDFASNEEDRKKPSAFKIQYTAYLVFKTLNEMLF